MGRVGLEVVHLAAGAVEVADNAAPLLATLAMGVEAVATEAAATV